MTSALWINFSRLLAIPSSVIASFYAASFVAVSDPFFEYVTTFILGLLIIVFLAPIIKRIGIDLLHGGANVAETTDRLGDIAISAVWLWFYPSGGPLWNVYLRMFGTKIELDTITAATTAGTASQASRLTIKNNSFISIGVRLSGTGPVVIDNAECAFGSVVPEGGVTDKQLLRHGHTRQRAPLEPHKTNVGLHVLSSIAISWLSVCALVMSLWPLYRAGVETRPFISSRAAFVLAFFVPAVLLQTVLVWPTVMRILSVILRRVPEIHWFMTFYFLRVWGSAIFFAGSPIHNLALIIQGAQVAAHARCFGSVRDDHRIVVQTGVVVDTYSFAMAHLYHQRKFMMYQTRLIPDTLYDGPGMYVGDPAKLH